MASATFILGAMRGVMLQFLLKPSAIDLEPVQAQLQNFLDIALAAPSSVQDSRTR
ncbi:hypothetical protein NVV94_12800 [Pseudomonas sp. LS1212]|uniref:hypothetical protein n=1 Tax=Pseudomonas sp. LS1212 TaxID=2972478 RepID=UPI00215D0CEC|nr:hypothetical protein [Pseudomonas sp. LS1212]UVJ46327.1 hypothetical protein NVV94_12800 [Pseudomonas sp. LS1212]